jgi:hypothetical protein
MRPPSLKIIRAKWTESGAGSRVPALQAKSLEFKPQSHQKTKNTLCLDLGVMSQRTIRMLSGRRSSRGLSMTSRIYQG